MAKKQLKLDLTDMKSNSEASTPTEEFHTPPAEGFAITPNEPFIFSVEKSQVPTPSQSRFESNDFRNMSSQLNIEEDTNNAVDVLSQRPFDNSNNRGTFRLPSRINPVARTSPTIEKKAFNMAEAKKTGVSREQVSDSDLVSIRKRLEERRKRIELEKKRVEQQASQQRQAVNNHILHTLIKSAGKTNDESLPQNENKIDESVIDSSEMPLQFSKPKDVESVPNDRRFGLREVSRGNKNYYDQESTEVLGKLFNNDENQYKSKMYNSPNNLSGIYNINKTVKSYEYDKKDANYQSHNLDVRNYANVPVKPQQLQSPKKKKVPTATLR